MEMRPQQFPLPGYRTDAFHKSGNPSRRKNHSNLPEWNHNVTRYTFLLRPSVLIHDRDSSIEREKWQTAVSLTWKTPHQ